MLILGINEGIDASIVLCKDGRVVFAVQEERLSREKGSIGFPSQAVMHCLKTYGLDARAIDYVCFSNLGSPASETREDLLNYYARGAGSWRELLRAGDLPGVATRFVGMLPHSVEEVGRAWWSSRKSAASNLAVERQLARFGLDGIPISRFHHHSNHAACAYYALCKNWQEPHLVFTLDGGGDDACAHIYLAQEGELRLLASTPTGHSLGNIYASVTFMLGMRPHEHEYKVMGLAPYADAEQGREVAKSFVRYLDLDPENPFRFKRTIPERTSAILPRLLRDFRRVRFDRLAAGLQLFTEDLIQRWIGAAVHKTGVRNVLAAGGVFMNVKANQRIAQLPGVEFFDVFPSCGDETLPFGAVWQCHVRQGGTPADIHFDDLYLGPEASADLAEARARYGDFVAVHELDDPEVRTAELLAQGHIVARCSGRMEFGARALGNRSILADPSRPGAVGAINRMIKQRDFWMPFAPAILGEQAERYILVPTALPRPRIAPFMMHAFETTDRRSEFIAAVHPADATARAQMVWRDVNPHFHSLIETFGRLTGRWVLLNTSFNLHGSPIVNGACDAVEVLLRSGLDYLVIDRYLVTKRQGTDLSLAQPVGHSERLRSPAQP